MRERDSNDLNTPESFLTLVRKLGPIALDPCSNEWSTVGAKHSFTREDNGLAKDWRFYSWTSYGKYGLVFVNPPYGTGCLIEWAKKIRVEAGNGCEIVSLVPCAPPALWFKVMRHSATAVCYLGRRISFVGGSHKTGMFDSVVFYYGNNFETFRSTFAPIGDVRDLRV